MFQTFSVRLSCLRHKIYIITFAQLTKLSPAGLKSIPQGPRGDISV